jgi:diguanylate cyclase (GGDEF)-like protein/PAS domain S-box-containing protein
MHLAPLLKLVDPLPPSLSISAVADKLMSAQSKQLLCLPVVDDAGRPIGIVSRYRLQDIFMKRYGRDLWERRPVTDIMNTQPLVIRIDTRLEEAADAVTAQLQYPITEDFILVDAVGRYLGTGMVLDLLKAMARDLGRNRRVMIRAQQLIGLGSWEWRASDDMLSWSPQLNQMLGLRPELSQAPLSIVLSTLDEQPASLLHAFFRLDRSEQPATIELPLRNSNGERRVIELQGEHYCDPENGEQHAVGTMQDITQRRMTEERLAHLASFDHLTQLPNRYLFQDRLEHAILQADRNRASVGLLFLDLDRFKWINDALGHAAGDELLKQVAGRLSGLVRRSDTVARLGGDEFTVILEGLADPSQAAAVAEKISQGFIAPFQLSGRTVTVSASIGITLYPSDAQDVETLLRCADAAMYRAKEQGRNRHFFYTAELNNAAHRRFQLEHGLRSALERGEFEVVYQPQLHTASGVLTSAEALLRWHSEFGPVSPGEFIPLLEDSQLIVPVGCWVMEQACSAAAAWQHRGLAGVRVAVNLSVCQLRHPDFVPMVKDVLVRTGLPPDLLEVEVTESVLLDDRGSADALLELNDLGVRVAIDDFGTGYSSLSYLKRFAVDTLKLDRSFVQDLTLDADDDAIASAVITLAHSMGITVTAEGVETAVQQRFLSDRACDHLQGFLISKPLAHDQFLVWAHGQTRTCAPHQSVLTVLQ